LSERSDLPDDEHLPSNKEIRQRVREDEVSRRLMTIPGVGPIAATAIAALAAVPETLSGAETLRLG
jgi:transposase